MSTDEFCVNVTAEDLRVVGEDDDGTRIYRAEGSSEDCARWFEYINDRFNPLVSPGGVSMYLPVSRAGVHKRLKAGKMTAFMFHTTHRERNIFGRERKVKEQPYGYIPVAECKAWAAEVAIRSGGLEKLREEISDGDYDDTFLMHDPRDAEGKDVSSGGEMTVREAVALMFDFVKSKPWKIGPKTKPKPRKKES